MTDQWLGYKVEAEKSPLGRVAGEGFFELKHERCCLWQRYSRQREWQRQSLRGENKCNIFRDWKRDQEQNVTEEGKKEQDGAARKSGLHANGEGERVFTLKS